MEGRFKEAREYMKLMEDSSDLSRFSKLISRVEREINQAKELYRRNDDFRKFLHQLKQKDGGGGLNVPDPELLDIFREWLSICGG